MSSSRCELSVPFLCLLTFAHPLKKKKSFLKGSHLNQADILDLKDLKITEGIFVLSFSFPKVITTSSLMQVVTCHTISTLNSDMFKTN